MSCGKGLMVKVQLIKYSESFLHEGCGVLSAVVGLADMLGGGSVRVRQGKRV